MCPGSRGAWRTARVPRQPRQPRIGWVLFSPSSFTSALCTQWGSSLTLLPLMEAQCCTSEQRSPHPAQESERWLSDWQGAGDPRGSAWPALWRRFRPVIASRLPSGQTLSLEGRKGIPRTGGRAGKAHSGAAASPPGVSHPHLGPGATTWPAWTMAAKGTRIHVLTLLLHGSELVPDLEDAQTFPSGARHNTRKALTIIPRNSPRGLHSTAARLAWPGLPTS